MRVGMSSSITSHKQQKNENVIMFAVLLGTFAVFFLGTQLISNTIYGYDFKNSPAYVQTMEATVNASNFTEGLSIDSYIQSVKVDICPTIQNNQTAQDECYNL